VDADHSRGRGVRRLKVITLGTGGPRPDAARAASCAALSVGGDYLVFDTGRGIVRNMTAKGIPFERVRGLFITHHHYDHIGELADFMVSSWLGGRRGGLPMFGPPPTAQIYSLLMHQVYDRDLEFRTQGEKLFGEFAHARVTDVRAGPVHEAPGWKISCEEMEHGHGLDFGPLFRSRWICLGYRIEAEGKVVTISGDGVMSDALVRLARGSDLHVQCCYLAAADLSTPHLKRLAQKTLACSDTAGKIAAAAGVKKLVLTHFRTMTPEMLAAIAADVRRDYAGPVHLANDLDEFEV
jgi:ribonuclease Z